MQLLLLLLVMMMRALMVLLGMSMGACLALCSCCGSLPPCLLMLLDRVD